MFDDLLDAFDRDRRRPSGRQRPAVSGVGGFLRRLAADDLDDRHGRRHTRSRRAHHRNRTDHADWWHEDDEPRRSGHRRDAFDRDD